MNHTEVFMRFSLVTVEIYDSRMLYDSRKHENTIRNVGEKNYASPKLRSLL
jgi:hypothetical protein